MEEALIGHLLGWAGLTELVNARIDWLKRPQGAALPAITLQRISGAPDYAMSGPTGLVSSRVQVDCWGSNYASTKLVARQVVAAVSGLRAVIGGIQFQGVFVETERDLIVSEIESSERLQRCSLDLIIWHS